jgi:hypothetical protein
VRHPGNDAAAWECVPGLDHAAAKHGHRLRR